MTRSSSRLSYHGFLQTLAQQLPEHEQNNSSRVAGRGGRSTNLFFLLCHKRFLTVIIFWGTVPIYLFYISPYSALPPTQCGQQLLSTINSNFRIQMLCWGISNSGFSKLATVCQDLLIYTLNYQMATHPQDTGLQTHCSNQGWLITNRQWPATETSQNRGASLLGSKSQGIKGYK